MQRRIINDWASWLYCVALVSSPVVGQQAAPRAQRPDWGTRDTSDVFFNDAFREAFHGQSPFSDRNQAAPGPPISNAKTTAESGEPWAIALDSQLVLDELKAIATRCDKRTRSARSFAGDARDETRRDLVVAATLFRILGQWEGNVRFKPEAAAASAAISETALAITNPSGEVLERAKSTSADMTDLVRGNRPWQANVEAPPWAQLVQRDDFMWRLEMAVEEAIADGLESEQALRQNQEQLAREANLTVALLMALRQQDAIDAERADYVEFARNAQREAAALRSAIMELDFARGKTALQNLRQACQACHEEYQ